MALWGGCRGGQGVAPPGLGGGPPPPPLDSRASLTGKDELAEIAHSFNQFVTRIHGAIVQVASNSR
ncbi:HAMP domain-containing protein, partial [Aeromonas caviae]|uniref:HAMP domain-containing protein n=1 Tax=Aeromonas caviae TaxID=648 RepID=UPI0029DB54DB